MAATNSTMLPLGTPAPDFNLVDAVSGNRVCLSDCLRDRQGLLVMFICNHCPFVKHVRAELAAIGKEYPPKGLGVVAISSNDVARYPDDSPDKMKSEARAAGYAFPYLFDDDQTAAKAFRAACTPDFYLFDGNGRLAYRGQLDDSRPNNGLPVTGRDLRSAIEAVLAGGSPSPAQKPSIGCNIKWKPGNEPDYAR